MFVGWNWYWDTESTSASEFEEDSVNSPIGEEATPICSTDEGDSDILPTIIVFKCIGTNKETLYQELLAEANRLLRTGVKVSVRLTPEPNNPVNSRAIAFECQVHGKWGRIGYVVNEVLEEVHKAINNNEIVETNFKWIKFITDWYMSGPGYFTAISISKLGNWAPVVVSYQSTR